MGQDAGVEKVLPDGIDGGRDAHPTICIDQPRTDRRLFTL